VARIVPVHPGPRRTLLPSDSPDSKPPQETSSEGPPTMSLHVAIDFGTTNSALAVATRAPAGDAKVELATFTVENEEAALATFPSILYSSPAHRGPDRRARVLAGHEALACYLAYRRSEDHAP